MKLRKLARLCEHDRYESHLVFSERGYVLPDSCPGGVFLPDDTLVIEKIDGEWPEWAQRAVSSFLEVDDQGAYTGKRTMSPDKLDRLLDALSVREAE